MRTGSSARRRSERASRPCSPASSKVSPRCGAPGTSAAPWGWAGGRHPGAPGRTAIVAVARPGRRRRRPACVARPTAARPASGLSGPSASRRSASCHQLAAWAAACAWPTGRRRPSRRTRPAGAGVVGGQHRAAMAHRHAVCARIGEAHHGQRDADRARAPGASGRRVVAQQPRRRARPRPPCDRRPAAADSSTAALRRLHGQRRALQWRRRPVRRAPAGPGDGCRHGGQGRRPVPAQIRKTHRHRSPASAHAFAGHGVGGEEAVGVRRGTIL